MFVGVVLYHRLQVPNWWVLDIRNVSKKHINLSLPKLIFKIVIEMPLDRSEKLKSAFCCFLNLLLVRQTTPILNRYQITHLLIQLRIRRKNS